MNDNSLYLASTVRKIEQSQVAAGAQLMVRAGLAAAQWIIQRFSPETRIAVLVGPGNNGGDGLTVARHLLEAGYPLQVQYFGDPERASAPTLNAITHFKAAGGSLAGQWSPDHQVVVDAMFGIGLARDLPVALQTLFKQINAAGQYVVALDTPSGLDADTGTVRDGALKANTTLSFIGNKPGLHTAHGRDYAGEIFIFDLDIPDDAFPAPDLTLYRAETLPHVLQRRQDSHKGSYGTVGIIGGAAGMTGAALLAGRAAIKLGAGKVRLGLLTPGLEVDLLSPELMLTNAVGALANRHDAWLVGPGLGQSDQAQELVRHILSAEQAIVVDADALNLIAQHSELQNLCRNRNLPAVITPHPSEATRLLGLKTSDIQADRLGAARRLSTLLGCITVLKGSGTVVADPAGALWINTSGNAALAAAGQGDTLGGIICSFIAQGLAPAEAARFGVFIHGAAADLWLQQYPAGIGLTASETADYARDVLNHLPA